MAVPIVFIGDDFTGASDSLATYARAGRRCRLVIRPDRDDDLSGLDVVGFATDLRALAPDDARATLERIWPIIETLDPKTLHFKVCSTFDSAPNVGSIGAAVAALEALHRSNLVAVIGGQPSLGRYCAFGTLFAKGPDGQVHRIDRHPVMSKHPVTPMHEADLRRHLAGQGLDHLELVQLPELNGGGWCRSRRLLVDAAVSSDIERISSLLSGVSGRRLLIGASSVAEILTAGHDCSSSETGLLPSPPANALLAFAGSRSIVTRAQVDAAMSYEKVPVLPSELFDPRPIEQARAALRRGLPTLLHLLPDADYGVPPAELADRSVEIIGAVLDEVPAGYLAICGGDTSSRICMGLGFTSLDYSHQVDHGVSVCVGNHSEATRDGMRLLLKGGQMGASDLLERFSKSCQSRTA